MTSLAIFVVHLVPETMSPFHVGSKVCTVLFMCGAKYEGLFDVRSTRNGRNTYFAPHIEYIISDFAPYMDQRHSFSNKKIVKTKQSNQCRALGIKIVSPGIVLGKV